MVRWNPPSDLLHKRQKIAHSPVVGDLGVLDTHDIDSLEVNLAVSWSDAKEVTFMCAVVRLVCRHAVTISELPVDLRMKVREGGTNRAVELTHAQCFIDGTFSKAKSGGDGIGCTRVGKGVKIMILVDAKGLPVAACSTPTPPKAISSSNSLVS